MTLPPFHDAKPSDFVRRMLDHLGSPERWCKGRYFTYGSDFIETGPAKFDVTPGLVQSACLEGTARIVDHEFNVGSSNGFSFDHPIHRPELVGVQARTAIQETLIEQFPEIVGNWRDEADKGGGKDWILTGSLPPASEPSVPYFNDHPSMTYEGVRSALEKTLAQLIEEGR